MSERIVRAAVVRLVDDGPGLFVIARDGAVLRLDDDSAALARAVLEEAAAPCTRTELRAAIAARGELEPGEVLEVVDQAIELLVGAGALVRSVEVPDAAGGGRVVLAVTGAAAALHTPALALALQRRGWTVEIAVSRAARRFVRPAALATITHRAVHTSAWPASAMAPVPHVALAAWADLVLVCPASATTIGRLAGGDFSDLVAAIALTTRAPVMLVPSMNPAMRESAAVARNLARCAKDGFLVMHGAGGVELADRPGARAVIEGAAPPPEEVAAIVDALWTTGALKRREPPARAPQSGGEWDVLWAATPEGSLPWASAEIDADLAAALAEHAPPPRTLLDAGTGLGVVARHAAAAGYQVVALDVAETALELARARSGDAPIVWLRDDLCAPALAARFGAIVDRGCLHVLPRSRHAAWAASMRRLLGPGDVLVVKVHRAGAAAGTTRFTAATLTALLGDGFEALSIADSELPGPRDHDPAPALLGVFRRMP